MGISEQMRRAHENEAAAAKEAEKALDARINAAGLHRRDPADFHWAKPSTVRGWELGDQDIFRKAAAKGDLFIKENANAVPVSATPGAQPSGDDDNDASFL